MPLLPLICGKLARQSMLFALTGAVKRGCQGEEVGTGVAIYPSHNLPCKIRFMVPITMNPYAEWPAARISAGLGAVDFGSIVDDLVPIL